MVNKAKEAQKEKLRKDKEWGKAIKLRDGNKCVICGREDYLHAHHIIPRERKEFRWDIDNGISLCVSHHKYSFEISAHKNSFVFMHWLINNRIKQCMHLITKWN